ncbi:hypothetical protein, partial [Caballeronia sp. AZ10_KS36]|uniref:hypothetical protein n=1 Tax=Caballeronia sp. AZ10_KS36 TaxID=2921757 RepID=UPI002028B6A0
DKPSSDTSCETLDTFACPAPKNRPHSPSSAHTYRLLVFKEQSAKTFYFTVPSTWLSTASSCVAASAAEKRDYEESFSPCQQLFSAFAFKTEDFGDRLFLWRRSSCDEERNSRPSKRQ